MNILMICYYYPPLADVGSKRSVAFSKYFKKHGWNPYVLSVKNPDKHYCIIGKEKSPEGVNTEYSYSIINLYWIFGKMNGALSMLCNFLGYKLARNYFYEFLCCPDHFIGWIPLTLLKGARMVKKNNIDAVYVSCSPFSAAIIGLLLKRMSGKPLILDFRDPFFIDDRNYFNITNIRRHIIKWFQKLYLEYTDLLFVTSEETRQMYIKAYPCIKDKIFTIYNGFDSAVFYNNKLIKYEKFTIIYTGEFYDFGPNHNVYTDLFFRALAYLKEKRVLSSENFQFLYFGNRYQMIASIADQYGIPDLVQVQSQIPYHEMLEKVSRSHLMLLKIVKFMISTKLYDAIPLNIPFLAIIPHGEVEEIIQKYSPASYILTENNNFLDVANDICDGMKKYKTEGMPNNHIQEFLGDFLRENMTLKMMQIVDDKILKNSFLN